MNKRWCKNIVAIVAVIALFTVLTVCLVGCNKAEDFEKRLKDKDYVVTSMTGDQIGEMLGDEAAKSAEWMVSAMKGNLYGSGEMVYVIKLKNSDDADKIEKEIAEMSQGNEDADVEFARKGKIIIFGTAQGVKDAQ